MNKDTKSLLPITVLLGCAALGYFLLPGLLADLLSSGGSAAPVMVQPLLPLLGMFCGLLIGFALAIPLERHQRRSASNDLVGSAEMIEIRLTGRGTNEKGEEVQVEYFKRRVPGDKLAAFWSQEAPYMVLRMYSADGLSLSLRHAADSPYADGIEGGRPVVIKLSRGPRVFQALETAGNGHISTPDGASESRCWFYLRYVGCEEVDVFATLCFKGPPKAMRAIFLA